MSPNNAKLISTYMSYLGVFSMGRLKEKKNLTMLNLTFCSILTDLGKTMGVAVLTHCCLLMSYR